MKLSSLMYAIVLVTVIFHSCKKIDVPEDTPRCIKKKIRKGVGSGAFIKEIEEYAYNSKTYYLFKMSYAGPKRLGDVYDEDCIILCRLDSLGIDSVKCPDFLKKANFIKQIWSIN